MIIVTPMTINMTDWRQGVIISALIGQFWDWKILIVTADDYNQWLMSKISGRQDTELRYLIWKQHFHFRDVQIMMKVVIRKSSFWLDRVLAPSTAENICQKKTTLNNKLAIKCNKMIVEYFLTTVSINTKLAVNTSVVSPQSVLLSGE